MSRRALTLLVAGIGVVAAVVAAIALPVPYVILSPGPTFNTLGNDSSGRPLIQIQGHPVYRASGHLNLVTVTFQGGPGDEINVFSALRGWLSPHEAVVPQEEVFGTGQSAQQVQQQDLQQMSTSQESATAAALRELGIGFTTQVSVASTEKGMPAYGVLQAGDLITAVDGKKVTSAAGLTSLIRNRAAGARVHLTILRHGGTRQADVGTSQVQGHPVIGFVPQEQYRFPFSVKSSVGDIGGPGAGLMFALGIIDKVTPTNLTGGRFIAGTGEIEASGAVDPIGGIQQKMAGARSQGATVFLTPAANCADTAGAVPAGMRLIKVSTLAGAVAGLEALKAGRPAPSC